MKSKDLLLSVFFFVLILSVPFYFDTLIQEKSVESNVEEEQLQSTPPVLSKQEQAIVTVIEQWSAEAGIPAPKVEFDYGEYKYTGYDGDGVYGEYTSTGSYFHDTNTIVFRTKRITTSTMRHEFIHYLQDVVDYPTSLKDQEIEAYYLSEHPIMMLLLDSTPK